MPPFLKMVHNKNIHLIVLLGGLNKLMCVKHSKQGLPFKCLSKKMSKIKCFAFWKIETLKCGAWVRWNPGPGQPWWSVQDANTLSQPGEQLCQMDKSLEAASLSLIALLRPEKPTCQYDSLMFFKDLIGLFIFSKVFVV